MRVLVGDETGLLKSIELEKSEQHVISSRKDPQARVHGIQSMCWYEDENQDATCKENVVVGRGNGIVESYSSAHGKSAASSSREANWSFTAPAGKSVGIGMIQKFGSVVRCTDAGDVFVKNMLSEAAKPSTFNVGPAVHRMRIEPKEQTHIAVGGKEHDLNIWSLEKQECVFKAKNVTHDNLDMRVPVWVKDIRFLSQGSSNGHRAVVGTGYQHVRIYDTNTKRRPVQEIKFGEYPVNALCVSPDETRVYIADTAGNLDILDLRTLKHLGRCTGPVGAIRDIACHPTLPYIAAVGLDRFVHVFDVNTRKYQHMVYAKQRLNTVVFCDDGVKEIPKSVEEPASKKRKMNDDDEEEEEFGDDDDEEEVYEGLELSEEDEEDEDDEEEDEEEDSD